MTVPWNNWNIYVILAVWSKMLLFKSQSTYIRRVLSCVWRLPKYWPPTTFSSQQVCPPPAPKAGGTHSPGGEGYGGSILWKTPPIGLASYNNLSTVQMQDNKFLYRVSGFFMSSNAQVYILYIISSSSIIFFSELFGQYKTSSRSCWSGVSPSTLWNWRVQGQ